MKGYVVVAPGRGAWELSRTRILVLERRGSLARSVAGVLPSQCYSVHVAPITRSSLRFLRTLEPDLVMLALETAGDWDLVPAIRARSAVPVIACGGCRHPVTISRGLRQGADDYVELPAAPEELEARIVAHLRRVWWSQGGAAEPG